MKIGVFPIRDHYYEPQFDHRKIRQPYSQARSLPGIDWNIDGQLKFIEQFSYTQELADILKDKPSTLDFYIKNGKFESGDAEYWYQLLRSIKPKKIFEVGSGYSTLMARKAIRKNQEEDSDYQCKHLCIEPYEMPWLDDIEVTIIRNRIEDIDCELFSELEENDIFFIDSSHVIRPQGDILQEYLEILPTLRIGVIVHIHDIFTPNNYPEQWLAEEVRLWNEQYILEAFLSNNHCWKIIGALNFIHHNHYDKLKLICPYVTPEREPGSFYIQKIA